MPVIKLTTEIKAPIQTCFNLSLDVGIHAGSMEHTDEKIISGRISGVCEAGDTITWEAVHFGIRQQLTVKVVRIDFPNFFEDQMLKGIFRSMRHKHFFSSEYGITIMKDEFNYESPLGIVGNLADIIFLKRYMTNLLMKRNEFIRMKAESYGK